MELVKQSNLMSAKQLTFSFYFVKITVRYREVDMNTKTGIFSGVNVLDLTKILSGPLATRYLADYGATVIKIEHPNSPDDSRSFPPLKNNWSEYFEMLNRNKESISLNLKNTKHRNLFYKLCKNADVVVENLTPDVKTKLKIDYPIIRNLNKKIIYASLSGLDQKNTRKYYDVIAQAESGLLSLSGTKKNPVKIAPAVTDAFAGVNLAFAIASALYHRQRTNEGLQIIVSMLTTSVQLLEHNLIDYSINGKNPERPENQDNAVAPFGVFKTLDGYLAIACGNDTTWNSFAKFLSQYYAIDLTKFTTNSLRLENKKLLTEIIEVVFSKFKTKRLVVKMNKIQIPYGNVNEMSDIANDDWFFKHEALIKIDHDKLGKCIIPGYPIQFNKPHTKKLIPAPGLGKNNNKYGI